MPSAQRINLKEVKMIVDSTAKQILFCTVRIEAYNNDKSSVGTGFFFSYKLEDGREAPFLVTNKHVIQGYFNGKVRFTLNIDGKPAFGQYIEKVFDNFDSRWFKHDDPNIDIAILPLSLNLNDILTNETKLFNISIPQEAIPNESQTNEFDALEEIIFVGYPNGLWDSRNNLPLIRKGITATPIEINFENKPIFLIDGSVFPGSSGSPVFLYNKGMIPDRHGNVQIGSRLLLLGILSAACYKEDHNILEMIESVSKPGITTREMIDIGIVYKSTEILNMVKKILSV